MDDFTASFPAPSEEEAAFLRSCLPALDESFFALCSVFGAFLYQTNETFNLTRIPRDAFWSKHVCDSLSILRAVPGLAGRLCDVGCGAGFPSLILAAALPDLAVTALDSTGKKVEFVRRAGERMGLKNLRTIHGRANELGRKGPCRGAFDYVTARAVSDALTLASEAGGLLTPKGCLVIYRTETQALPEAEQLADKKIRFYLTEEFALPGDAGRRMFMTLENLR